MRIRPAAVAGSFYPADPDELSANLDVLLAEARPGPAPKALIAPHAGYIYSGPIAASAFVRLRGAPVRRIVLLGPAHFEWLHGIAVPDADRFSTPLGDVPIEPTDLPVSRSVHAREHSLEVEVPFLQKVLGDFTLVPIAVGDADPVDVAEAIERLWGGPETAIVVSSDLSHYLSYRAAQAHDHVTAERIVSLQVVPEGEACGSHPVNALLEVARRKHMKCELLDLRNSGDTSGDKGRVVGYGAFALS